MSPDLSNLKLVDEVIETFDESQYKDAQEFPPPIPEGIYLFLHGKPTFEPTKDGLLGATMDHVVAEGEHKDAKIMFDRVSEKKFERSGVRGASTMMDQIRAVYGVGSPERSARTRGEMAAALEAAEGKPFKGKVQWDGYCSHKDTPQDSQEAVSIKYEKNFPQGSDVQCKTCGKPIRPRARIGLRIAAN